MEEQQFNIKEATNEQLNYVTMSIKSNMADAFVRIEECKQTQETCVQQINQMQVSIAQIAQEVELRKGGNEGVVEEEEIVVDDKK